ncbi:Telomere length and silencing protein 1 [Clonorchis sinensis]|uniref:Telomere length and silencing protein 1 n=1 Tax=Clonorchis sinensis TaxID=79923 RepID=A0A419PFU4_CLOSI|nr:Telomere length and silencing protein 1 [Clonorchis sinensis]
MDSAKKRCLRTRRPSDSSESEEEKTNDSNEIVQQEDSTHVVEAIRELQKVRKRPPGISLSALSTGKAAPEETIIVSDPFKLKTGGLVEIRKAIRSKKTEEEDDVEARLAKTFATETNKRDEDAEMFVPFHASLIPFTGLSISKKKSLDGKDYDVLHLQNHSHNATTTFSSGDYTRDLLSIASKANPHKTDIVHQQTTGLDAERERLGAERSTDSLVLQRFKSHMRGRKRR